MRINTNVASLQAQEAAKNTARSQSSSLEKLGTGLNINKAADDGAGLAIADKLRTQASSINQSLSNANSASALVNIADKAMSEQSNILDTIKTKLIQAGTSTTTDDGREAIRKDITKLLDQFDNIASQTNYNGITLLQKGENDQSVADTFSFQIGEDASFDIDLTATKAVNTASLGGGADAISSGTLLEGKDGQKITDTGTVTLKSVLVDKSGSAVASTANGLNLNVSGNLGSAFTNTGGQLTISAGSESNETKLLLKSIGDNNATSASWDTATSTLTINAGSTFDLSDINFSNAKLEMGATGTSIDVTNSSGFTITNNQSSGLGKEKVEMTTTGEMKGGDLLSSIKNLAADELTAEKANDFMSTIDESLTQLNEVRTDFGSAQNQIESSIRNLETTFTNIKAAESVIRDVDYAAESASFNKQNIIAQAGTYAMSQANAMQQNVSRLLQ